MLEKDIVRQILGYLRGIGAYCGKTKTMGVKRGRVFCYDPFTFRGFPDICCFWRNAFYFIEVKRPGAIQSPEQKTFQEYALKANLTYILAYSLDDVTKIIR